MLPLAIVLFLCGMVALLVGATRVSGALRVALASPDHVRAGHAVAWTLVALYGLVLASVGMLITR